MANETTNSSTKLTEAVKEYKRCVDDPVYFINNYIRQPFTQEITIEQFNEAANKVIANQLAFKTGYEFNHDSLH